MKAFTIILACAALLVVAAPAFSVDIGSNLWVYAQGYGHDKDGNGVTTIVLENNSKQHLVLAQVRVTFTWMGRSVGTALVEFAEVEPGGRATTTVIVPKNAAIGRYIFRLASVEFE